MSEQILIRNMISELRRSSAENINIMEVCGTHTQAISRFGIRQLVEPNIHFLSGPGCPVCVTSESYIDAAIELSKASNVILTTFGDMMKVRGSKENLIEQKEKGKEIQILYSPLEAVTLAEKNKGKEVVFLGVGFETTTPLIALAVKTASEKGIKNLSFLIGMKRMEPMLHHILSDANHRIEGFICPGHVSAVMGEEYFEFIVKQYNIPTVIAGFEAIDIIGALYFLVKQQGEDKKYFKNLYKSCVPYKGNRKANRLMEEMFTYCDADWRGIGTIEASGFALRDEYKNLDAAKKFNIKIEGEAAKSCVCSEILLGKKLPINCLLFGKDCTPENPVGPCMVSTEGACSIFYRYKECNR